MSTASHENARAATDVSTSTSSAPVVLPLSPMDAAMNAFGFTILYIFPPPSSASASASSAKPFDLERLHTSFQSVVENDYRVLLGELHVHPTTGVVSVHQSPACALQGAAQAIPFEKCMAGNNDSDSDDSSSSSMSTEAAMQSLSMAFMPTRAPTQPVAIKATLLRDGGLAIGVDMSHTLLDGEGMFTFMAVWGEHYRNVPSHTRTVVHHDRSLLAARGVGPKLLHPEFKLRPSAVASAAAPSTTAFEPAPAPDSVSAFEPAPARTSTQHAFRLTPSMLEQLKAVVLDVSDGDTIGSTTSPSYISTIDVVTALFVLLITRARGHQQDVRLTTGVNARARFEPPLPQHYVGNVIFNALSVYKAEEVADLSPAAVRAVAMRIRASIRERDDAFLRDAIEFVAAHANVSDVVVGTDFFFGPDVMVTSWVRFGMYDADFGARPWFVGPPRLPLLDGMVIVMEAMRSAPGLDVVVLLETNAMARLRELWATVPFWT